MSIFTQWTQTNEFGEYLGMPHNPTCLANKGDVCGFVDQKTLAYSPQVVCCSGMACHCDPRDTQCFCK